MAGTWPRVTGIPGRAASWTLQKSMAGLRNWTIGKVSGEVSDKGDAHDPQNVQTQWDGLDATIQ